MLPVIDSRATPAGLLSRRVPVDLSELAVAGAALCAASALLPQVPGYPGVSCPLRATTGIPCPLCGLSTSVRATLGADLSGAVAANPAGVAVVAMALCAPVASRSRLSLPVVAAPAMLLCLWIFQLFRFA